jgi:predicted 2-oxoglutarate/Fe(II)-dependent dioxygenase YbiX
MNFQNNKLTDFIFVDSNAIPSNLSDYVIKKSNDYQWQTHTWYGPNKDKAASADQSYAMVSGDEKEFDRAIIDKQTSMQLNSYIKNSVNQYKKLHQIVAPISFNSTIAINKYTPGTRMKNHSDHIYSLFDGSKKGIPVLSVVGLLNDDFYGGDFTFWQNYKVTLKKGDILIFPSLFLYSHGVEEIKEGTRYSIVLWYW